MGSIPGLGRSPGEGNGNPLQCSCLAKRCLASYTAWGHKESDTAERLSTHTRTAGSLLSFHLFFCPFFLSHVFSFAYFVENWILLLGKFSVK